MRVAGLGMEDSLGTIEEELEQLDLSTGQGRGVIQLEVRMYESIFSLSCISRF